MVRASFSANTPSASAISGTMFLSIPQHRARGEPVLIQSVRCQLHPKNTPVVLQDGFFSLVQMSGCHTKANCEKFISPRFKPRFYAAFWDYTATCVFKSLPSKATSQRRKKTPKHKTIYWDKFRAGREIFGLLGGVWSALSEQSTVQVGGNSRPFVFGQNGALRGVTAGGPTSQTQAHTQSLPLSLSLSHACTDTHTCVVLHTHGHSQKTITFLCFYECFINHVNGSQSYTPLA